MPRATPRVLTLVPALIVVFSCLCIAQNAAVQQWKGRREVVIYDFGTEREEVTNAPPKIYQSGHWTLCAVDIYQDKNRVVRYVLSRVSGARKSPPPEFTNELVDFRNKSIISLGIESTAYRCPMNRPGTITKELEARRLLGSTAEGKKLNTFIRTGSKRSGRDGRLPTARSRIPCLRAPICMSQMEA